MVYRTDGSSHHDGVANEHASVQFINEKSKTLRQELLPADHLLRQVGGTKTKIDAQVVGPDGSCCESFSISIKNHKGANGTFDWMNTTMHTDAVKEALKEFKAAGNADRRAFNAIFSTHLHGIGDEVIRSLLNKCAQENPPWLLVNNVARREYVLARTPSLAPLDDWNYFLKFGRGTTSAQVWRRLGSIEVNTRLRLRLVSNNGLKALFGAKGSVPCFKIQQEHVKDFLTGLRDAVRETWT